MNVLISNIFWPGLPLVPCLGVGVHELALQCLRDFYQLFLLTGDTC